MRDAELLEQAQPIVQRHDHRRALAGQGLLRVAIEGDGHGRPAALAGTRQRLFEDQAVPQMHPVEDAESGHSLFPVAGG